MSEDLAPGGSRLAGKPSSLRSTLPLPETALMPDAGEAPGLAPPTPGMLAWPAAPQPARRHRPRIQWPPGGMKADGAKAMPERLRLSSALMLEAGREGHENGHVPRASELRRAPEGLSAEATAAASWEQSVTAAHPADRQAPGKTPEAGDEYHGVWRWIEPGRIRMRQAARGNWRNGLSRTQARMKRALDLSLVLLGALPAGLICLICMAAIRLDSPGPAIFAQWRTGRDGRRFRFWKLRTMVVDAEVMEEQLRPLSRLPWPDFKIEHDPRVTRVGRWLRRTSLDELPQLWNVWQGEMSLVGPRPTNFSYETWRLWHTERLTVPPGMTGLWQVLGRGSCSFDQRLRQDLAYIRAWRLSLDLKILLLTLIVVFTGKGGK